MCTSSPVLYLYRYFWWWGFTTKTFSVTTGVLNFSWKRDSVPALFWKSNLTLQVVLPLTRPWSPSNAKLMLGGQVQTHSLQFDSTDQAVSSLWGAGSEIMLTFGILSVLSEASLNWIQDLEILFVSLCVSFIESVRRVAPRATQHHVY